MKCPKCNGDGWDDEHMIKCLHCHGSGEIALTNEDWFCGLSTEEKAELIYYIGFTTKERWLAWLKQPHKEE